ncbi:hypothetical protein ABEI56_03865 [Peribacillus castrilensis]|uniref:Uncharacterized protein n=1 Tax=Peribacillus frigoritolerans TaxID=450367 RepID=A0AAJ1QRP7_9BACI|nr:hypothetical protein [Peribacillus frigoritolerans]MDM5286492.1 hypothetical protein [Peribacillus frigoritolerans]
MDIPEELDLISVFGTIPKRKDETDAFYYDTSTFVLENEKEKYEIILSPFYHEFSLSVREKKTNNVLSYIELLSVNKIEIMEDKKEHSKIRLFHGDSDRYVNITEITLKPRFHIIFREQYC